MVDLRADFDNKRVTVIGMPQINALKQEGWRIDMVRASSREGQTYNPATSINFTPSAHEPAQQVLILRHDSFPQQELSQIFSGRLIRDVSRMGIRFLCNLAVIQTPQKKKQPASAALPGGPE